MSKWQFFHLPLFSFLHAYCFPSEWLRRTTVNGCFPLNSLHVFITSFCGYWFTSDLFVRCLANFWWKTACKGEWTLVVTCSRLSWTSVPVFLVVFFLCVCVCAYMCLCGLHLCNRLLLTWSKITVFRSLRTVVESVHWGQSSFHPKVSSTLLLTTLCNVYFMCS